MGIPLANKINKDTDRGREGDLFVPDDKYFVKVLNVEEKEKKDADGETFIHAEYEILDSATDVGKDAIGLRIFDLFSNNEAATWKIAKFLDCCSAPDTFEGDEIPDDIEGKELVVRVKQETYNKNTNARVKAYMDRFNWKGVTMQTDGEGDVVMGKKGNAASKKPSGNEEVSV